MAAVVVVVAAAAAARVVERQLAALLLLLVAGVEAPCPRLVVLALLRRLAPVGLGSERNVVVLARQARALRQNAAPAKAALAMLVVASFHK